MVSIMAQEKMGIKERQASIKVDELFQNWLNKFLGFILLILYYYLSYMILWLSSIKRSGCLER